MFIKTRTNHKTTIYSSRIIQDDIPALVRVSSKTIRELFY